MSGKYALIIANTEYSDPRLAQLTAPGIDAQDLAKILNSTDICAFDNVGILLNQPEPIVRDAIDIFFDSKKPDDLLVLYFSGHGIRDEIGALYLAVQNTNRYRLRTTAIKSDFIRESMDQSRSRRQILILDCCNSGAFSQGTKAVTGGSIGTASAFEGNGYGRIVLTASDSTQFAWEGDKVIGETENSLFTHFLIKGLEGEADTDHDGRITVDDLYDYAYEKIVTITPKQTPGKWSYKQQGEIALRELTDAQKEEMQALKLAEQQRLAREEANRLALARAEQETVEKEIVRLKRERETAELAAREATEKFASEKARRDALHSGTEILVQDNVETQTTNPVSKHPQPTSWKYSIILTAVIIVTVAIFGLNAFSNNNKDIGSISTQQNTPQEAVSTLPSSIQPFYEKTPAATPISLPGTPISFESSKLSLENVRDTVQLARWGKGTITDVAYSPDGKLLALSSTIGIYLMDAGDLKEINLIANSYNLNTVTFSADGKSLLAISTNGDLLEFRVSDGKFVNGTKKNETYIYEAAFSPDTKVAALLLNNSQILLQNTDNGGVIKLLEPNISDNIFLRTMEFSTDGNFIAIGTNKSTVLLLNAIDGELIRVFDGQSGNSSSISGIAFSPDSKFMTSSSYNGSVMLWNVADGTLLQTFEGHDVSISTIEFSFDGQALIYGLEDKEIRIRQISDGQLIKSFTGHTDWINNITLSPSGENFASIADDGTIKLWNNESGLIRSADGFYNHINNISISPDGKMLASASNVSIIWKITDGNIIKSFSTGSSDSWVAFLPNSQKFSLSSYKDLSFWEFSETDFVQTGTIDYLYANIVAYSPNQGAYATTSYSDTIDLWITMDGYSSPKALEGHTENITSLAFSPDGELLASGSEDNTIRLWNVINGSINKTLNQHLGAVTCITFSPDGKTLASGSDDGTIILWNIGDETLIKIMETPAGINPSGIIFSPDGQMLASGADDGSILLWQINNGELLQRLTGHTSYVTSLAYTPDGKILASSSSDGTIRLWGVKP